MRNPAHILTKPLEAVKHQRSLEAMLTVPSRGITFLSYVSLQLVGCMVHLPILSTRNPVSNASAHLQCALTPFKILLDRLLKFAARDLPISK
jgi:hypothetical protein